MIRNGAGSDARRGNELPFMMQTGREFPFLVSGCLYSRVRFHR
jgi:hypothetical protein